MKRIASLLAALVFTVIAAVSAGASESSFTLTESSMAEIGADVLEYLPAQKIFHFRKYGTVTAEIPAAGGVYVCVIAGGYRSDSNGVTDNGIDHVCDISLEYFDSEGNEVSGPMTGAITMSPADGKFHSWRIGTDEMYSAVPENVSTARLTVTGLNDTAYIKSMYIAAGDTHARDTSDALWQHDYIGNINAQTRPADYLIMVGGVFAVALLMFGFRKWRDRIKKK